VNTKNKSRKLSRRLAGCGIFGLIALLAVTAAALLIGGPRMDPAARALLETADTLYREGRFEEAAPVYLDALELAPDNPRILKQLGSIALWNNRSGEAEQYYQEALRATPWYANIWPLTSDLKYRLSLAYYRQDRFADAASIIREAVGPLAVGPLADLQALGRQMELFADQTPYEIEGPEESRVDFVVTDPLPVVEVSCNGSPPAYFVVDTGGAEVILDREWAEEIGAEIAGSFTGTYGGGKTAETGLGKIQSINIGDFTVRNVPIHTLETTSFSSGFNGLEIKGVVTTRFLMHFLSTIDYANGALILRQLTPENRSNLEQQIAESGAKTVPFWLIDIHYIVAWGSVNDLEPMLFFVDTGLAGKGFTAPEPVLQAAGIAVDWSKAREDIGGGGLYRCTDILVERLTLGEGRNEIVEENVPGDAMENSASILGDKLGFHIGGLISHQFFRDYALTFDFTGMRLILQEGGMVEGNQRPKPLDSLSRLSLDGRTIPHPSQAR
jgi:hypothetical protein